MCGILRLFYLVFYANLLEYDVLCGVGVIAKVMVLSL